MRKRIVAGNWKMNMNYKEANDLFEALSKIKISNSTNVIIAPPSIYLSSFKNNNNSIFLSSQNVSNHNNGAYTGEISAEMLSSLDINYCIVGHSERRSYYSENDKLISKKIDALLNYKISPIYCCGELKLDRESQNQQQVVKHQIEEALFHLSKSQIKSVIIAYEPVWAIGTGLTASSEDAQNMHFFIRNLISEKYDSETAQSISILYGGSCKPNNAKELFSQPDIDGGLIGGASLNHKDFSDIIFSF